MQYPNLKNIALVAHSGGGYLMQRFLLASPVLQQLREKEYFGVTVRGWASVAYTLREHSTGGLFGNARWGCSARV